MWIRNWALGLTGAATLLLAPVAMAEPGFDWATYLQADRVSVAGGKLSYREVERCQMSIPGQAAQNVVIEWSSEAPAKVLSRDTFATLNGRMASMFVVSVAGGLGATIANVTEVLKCTPAGPSAGKPGVKFNVIYDPVGLVLSVTDTASGNVTRHAESWNDVFDARVQATAPDAEAADAEAADAKAADATPGASGGAYFGDAVVMIEKVAEVVAAHADNCDLMGDALSKFADANSEKIESLSRFSKAPKDKEAEAQAMEKYKDRIMAAMGKMMPTQMKCKDNARLKAAMKKINF